MSTGKRLAKRSIIGTRVCAPGDDGKYYSGVIHAVKTPASASSENGLSITPKTRYSVRFDPVPGGRPPCPSTEFLDRDLIGPGFGSVTTARLVPGQKVYLTYNGREVHAEVTQHRKHLDEVDVVIAPTGQESTMNLTKRIDEVRLLESRKSARLADQDTDFARLADMAGDRKRTSTHNIDVPHINGFPDTINEVENRGCPTSTRGTTLRVRKRRTSSGNDSERAYNSWSDHRIHGCSREGCRHNERDCMDECSAALVLMSLSGSPHSTQNPLPLHCQHNYGSWGGRGSGNVVMGSPGAGTSNSSSSSGGSWRTGTPSPPLSDEGVPMNGSVWPSAHHASHNLHQQQQQQHYAPNSTSGSPTGNTDEGIVPDFLEEHPRKKKYRIEDNSETVVKTEIVKTPPIEFVDVDRFQTNAVNDHVTTSPNSKRVYKCCWPNCLKVETTQAAIEEHIRVKHLHKKAEVCENEDDKYDDDEDAEDDDMSELHEEEFYYQEISMSHMSSPPTMSHRDMARPPHEDPEYQKQLRLEAAPITAPNCTENLVSNVRDRNNTYAVSSSPQASPVKHIKLTPRPQQFQTYQQSVGLLTVSVGKMPSPRRVRGETKKCRKVYGMEHRDLWCTQCKWKKACTRFGD